MMARMRAMIPGREDSRRTGEIVRWRNQQQMIDGKWDMNDKQQTLTFFKVVTTSRDYIERVDARGKVIHQVPFTLNLCSIHVDIAQRQLDMWCDFLGRGQSWRYSFGIYQHLSSNLNYVSG